MSKKPEEQIDGNAWMNTYSDMVTLLLCFFALLLSFSQVNAEKWEQIVKAFVNPGDETAQVVIVDPNQVEPGEEPLPNNSSGEQIEPGVSSEDSPLPVDFDDLFEYLDNFIKENNLTDSVTVTSGGDNVVYIRFQNNIFFAPNEYKLLPEGREILGFLGDCVHNVEDQIYIISINGHTAAVDWGDFGVSDWMLSSERASAVAIFLEDNKGIDPTKMRPMGYGRNFPIADNTTDEGKRQNRRVDITIIRDTQGSGDSVTDELASLFDPSQFPRSGGVTDIMTPGS